MFDAATYAARREELLPLAARGPLLFPGNPTTPRNYAANPLPFKQNSHFLYLCGLSRPDLWLVVCEDGATLFGPEEDPEDLVWHGPHATLEEEAAWAGITRVESSAGLADFLSARAGGGRRPLYLPPFHPGVALALAKLLSESPSEAVAGADAELARTLCDMRLVKSAAEVDAMEAALEITRDQHLIALREARAGMLESELLARATTPARARSLEQAYRPILSVRGEVLHNETHANRLEAGQLVLNDSGVEGPSGYASDVTRTFPVDGRFDARQRVLYEVVLRAEEAAIEAVTPGRPYRDVHLLASRVLAEGLVDFGLLKGAPEDIVESGAHALFFPHGVGHMIGLDVHDMEDLGDLVGYGGEGRRSSQFGLSNLRLARELEPGHVVTIEPGFYVIPGLIERFAKEGRHDAFIDFDRARELVGFGGIRIEDDVLVTAEGRRILGPPIPKSVEEVEELRRAAVG